MADGCAPAARTSVPRFVLVVLPGLGGRERHALPPDVPDAEATLCGLPRPGRWATDGFTCRLMQIDCMPCRIKAGLLLPHRPVEIMT